jgi:hypothetical protein
MRATIAVVNQAASFLSGLQRRLKYEPYDVWLFDQTSDCIAMLVQIRPSVIVLGRRVGYPAIDTAFLDLLHRQVALRGTPILLSVPVGVAAPKRRRGVVMLKMMPGEDEVEHIVLTLERILTPVNKRAYEIPNLRVVGSSEPYAAVEDESQCL